MVHNPPGYASNNTLPDARALSVETLPPLVDLVTPAALRTRTTDRLPYLTAFAQRCPEGRPVRISLMGLNVILHLENEQPWGRSGRTTGVCLLQEAKATLLPRSTNLSEL